MSPGPRGELSPGENQVQKKTEFFSLEKIQSWFQERAQCRRFSWLSLVYLITFTPSPSLRMICLFGWEDQDGVTEQLFHHFISWTPMGCLKQLSPTLKTSRVLEASLLLAQEMGKSQVKHSQCFQQLHGCFIISLTRCDFSSQPQMREGIKITRKLQGSAPGECGFRAFVSPGGWVRAELSLPAPQHPWQTCSAQNISC